MVEVSNICVPVDFSDVSRKALDFALAIARVFESEVLLTHVVEDRPVTPYFASAMHDVTRPPTSEVEARLGEWLTESAPGSVACRTSVLEGGIDDEILAAIAREQADLVVMGTHGRRAFKRWMLGSVTEHILRKIPVPVITLSHLGDADQVWPVSGGCILYATDLSPGSERGMDIAADLSRRFGAELIVLHVMRPPSLSGIEYFPSALDPDQAELRHVIAETLEQSVPEAIRGDLRVRTELHEGVPYESILGVAGREKAGLIIVNLHGRGRIERAFIGSTAERVVRAATLPVLSIPVPDS